jgi:APA family basic amino acid/polyamine antiporter
LNQTGLSREIGLLDATMIVVSGVIGGGIFFTPSAVAGHLPNPAWIIAVWLVGALIAYAGALTFAELVTRFPQAGGHYVYIRQGFGPLWAFLYGWMLLLIIATGALASLALAFGGYLAAFFPLSVAAQKIVGVLIIIGFSALNILGVKPGARTTTILTVVKVAAIALMIGLGLFMEPRTPPTATIDMPATGTMLLGFGAALVPVLFSYGGWQQLNFLAGEVRSPERRVPLALALGVSIVAVVYVGMNVVYLRALGPAGMAASTALARDAGVVLFGDFASRAITALVAVSILAFSNVVIMATPRVFYAMAQDGVFLRGLSVLHPRFRTPARAIALQGIWAIVLVLIGNIGVLVNGVVFADWIFFGLGAASIFVIRRRDTASPAYRVPGYPFVPAFFVLAALVAVGSAIVAYPKESSIGVGMMAIGAGLYNVFKRRSA